MCNYPSGDNCAITGGPYWAFASCASLPSQATGLVSQGQEPLLCRVGCQYSKGPATETITLKTGLGVMIATRHMLTPTGEICPKDLSTPDDLPNNEGC
jgi:hypothetical protein